MKNCILCGKLTNGSTGKAGIKWSIICQSCKDIEDEILVKRIECGSKAINKIMEVCNE